MKKRTVMMLMMAACIGMTGTVMHVLADENGAETGTDSEVETETASESESETETEDSKEKIELKLDENLTEILLDEAYVVESEDGTYSFTITGVKKTEWMTNEGKSVLLLCYEVSNEDYEPSDGSLLMLNDTTFAVTDEYGDTLTAWDSTRSEYGFPDFVEAGETKTMEQPYVMEQDSEQVLVIYSEKGEEKSNIIIDVELPEGAAEETGEQAGEETGTDAEI